MVERVGNGAGFEVEDCGLTGRPNRGDCSSRNSKQKSGGISWKAMILIPIKTGMLSFIR